MREKRNLEINLHTIFKMEIEYTETTRQDKKGKKIKRHEVKHIKENWTEVQAIRKKRG